MTDVGLLNGQPVGRQLPPSVPCESCGHPVWLTKRVVAPSDREDGSVREWRDAVLEQTFPKPGQAWALESHRCRVPGGSPEPGSGTGPEPAPDIRP